jgi:uncharacterized NAD-dependent epimerase/dehydratase family protein
MICCIDGNAIIYCEGALNSLNGKTAHGLLRYTTRYNIISVIDSTCAGRDSGEIIDNKPNGIPVHKSFEEALLFAKKINVQIKYLVVGLAPDGGMVSNKVKKDLYKALQLNLNIDSGLHYFLSEDPEFIACAAFQGLTIRDIRKTPHRGQLHFFSGKIEAVKCFKLAILGTDSAVGKRTTAWVLIDGLRKKGLTTELIGTGQTAWMQGAKYSIIIDSLINDFVSGEIEHAVYEAWKNEDPDILIIEGQGSLLNPAYPGGFEILAAGRPDYIILQHAPKRKEYDGFPGYKLHPLSEQLKAIETVSGKKVIAVTINHEGMAVEEILMECKRIENEIGLPVIDILADRSEKLVSVIQKYFIQWIK